MKIVLCLILLCSFAQADEILASKKLLQPIAESMGAIPMVYQGMPGYWISDDAMLQTIMIMGEWDAYRKMVLFYYKPAEIDYYESQAELKFLRVLAILEGTVCIISIGINIFLGVTK